MYFMKSLKVEFDANNNLSQNQREEILAMVNEVSTQYQAIANSLDEGAADNIEGIIEGMNKVLSIFGAKIVKEEK